MQESLLKSLLPKIFQMSKNSRVQGLNAEE